MVIGAISGGQVRKAVGAFHADLFVNDENHKLPVYAFPPTGRVSLEGGRVLFPENVPVGVRVPTGSYNEPIARVYRRNSCEVSMAAPEWLLQPWFNRLLARGVDHPCVLSLLRSLLRQPGTSQFHQDPARMSLHPWRLPSIASAVRGFQAMCPSVLLRFTEPVPGQSTTAAGAYFVTGAPYRVRTLSLPLSG